MSTNVINMSFLTNKFINDEEPWKLKESNIEKMNNILHLSLEQIAKISLLLSPIIPIATTKVLTALSVNKDVVEQLNTLFSIDMSILYGASKRFINRVG